MPGLYIHIPFCRESCHYCDFHFSISMKQMSPMLLAIRKELLQRKSELEGQTLNTVYIGGGTPSVLSPEQLLDLLDDVYNNYVLSGDAEITMEANPEDLNIEYLDELKKFGINRLSIGIQSFQDKDLAFMNRTHNGKQSSACLENCRNAGFNNLNIDLIYGYPGLTNKEWSHNLDQTIRFMPEHVSAYHMTYEPGSVMDYRRHKKRIDVPGEEESLDQYKALVDRLKSNDYLHYEISSFSLPGFISKHNSAYWQGEKYIGVGPSAHSFDGKTRRWNFARNASYIKDLSVGGTCYGMEKLSSVEKFHDYIMTRLRTSQGADLEFVKKEWGRKYYEHCQKESAPFIKSGMMEKEKKAIKLTDGGMFIADHIISRLFMQT